MFLAATLEQPLLLEGEAGVGKTEVAKALAGAAGARLIRLQCHEGIDLHHALYDWDYPRQLLHLRAGSEEPLYSERFLLRRPLLEALQASEPVVLLIDEIDRADDEFEAFLLEFLSDFQVSIPELGTVVAARRPLVVVDLQSHSGAARRIEEAVSVPLDRLSRAQARGGDRAGAAAGRAGRDRRASMRRRGAAARARSSTSCPGVGETIAWAQALLALEDADLDETLGVVLKVREDIDRVRERGVLHGA